jgi:hypothetical protein
VGHLMRREQHVVSQVVLAQWDHERAVMCSGVMFCDMCAHSQRHTRKKHTRIVEEQWCALV